MPWRTSVGCSSMRASPRSAVDDERVEERFGHEQAAVPERGWQHGERCRRERPARAREPALPRGRRERRPATSRAPGAPGRSPRRDARSPDRQRKPDERGREQAVVRNRRVPNGRACPTPRATARRGRRSSRPERSRARRTSVLRAKRATAERSTIAPTANAACHSEARPRLVQPCRTGRLDYPATL